MKLELKYLAPYLPYGLKIAYNRINSSKYLFTNIRSLDENGRINGHVSSLNIKDIKPLLIPLSELKTRFDKHLSNYWSDFDFYVKCILEGDFRYSEMQDLIEQHFDVFGLIDAGLALNKLNPLKS